MSGWLRDLRSKLAHLAEALPCLVILAGLLNGALFPLQLEGFPSWSLASLCLPGILVAGLLLPRGRFLAFAVCTVLGFASVQVNAIIPQDDYSRAIDGRKACGAFVEARVADPSCCGEELEWMPNPKFTLMKAQRLRLPGETAWRNVSGYFAAVLPDKVKPDYGDVLRLDGSFLTPEKPVADGAFDYGRYLELRAVWRTFDAQSAEIIAPGTGFLHVLFEFRNGALKTLCSSLKSDESKRLAAALSFGCQQGVSWGSRVDFLRSGTIHILSVSGLHVAMVAVLLGFALCFVPFRTRYVLLPLLTLLYSLMTGLQAPSFRAFAMLAVWSLLRAALLSTSAFNTTLLAASLLILWRPSQMLETGFQYSFITVLFLIGSVSLFQEWRACALERSRWVPAKLISFSSRLKTRLLEWSALALASCVIAWLASCGLSLLYQGLGAPASIPANLALIPLTWVIFTVFALEGLLFWVPGFLSLAGAVQETALKLMTDTCAFFANWSGGGCAPMPPWWAVALFLALLTVAMTAKGRGLVLGACLGVALMLSFWFSGRFFERPELMILHGGQTQEPMLAISAPDLAFAVVVNAPDFDAARQTSAYFASRGVSSVDALVLGGAAKDFCGGAGALLASLKVSDLLMPAFGKQALTAVSLEDKAKTMGLEMSVGKAHCTPLLEASFKKREYMVECKASGLNIVVSARDCGDGVHELELRRPDGSLIESWRLVNSFARGMLVRSLESL